MADQRSERRRMTPAEAQAYLRKRVDQLIASFYTSVTRWTHNDIVAVGVLLEEMASPLPTLDQIAQAAETMLEQEQPDPRA